MLVINNIKYYNITEMAQIIGVSVATVRKYSNKKQIKTTKLLGRDHSEEKEIARFLTLWLQNELPTK